MAEEVTTTDAAAEPAEDTVSADRFREVAKHKKAAEDREKQLKKEMEELRSQLEEREQASLPELERERKAREQLEKQLSEERGQREKYEREMANLRKQDWLKEAARELNFHNPAVAARLVSTLDDIESSEDAARAMKKIAKADKWLIRDDEPQRPEIGRVLAGGQATQPGAQQATSGDLADPAFKRQMGEEMLSILRPNG